MIGKLITYLIENDEDVQASINGSLFPISDIFNRDDDNLPAIYYIVKCIPNYNKCGQSMQDWYVTFITMCTDYGDSWNLSIKLKELFEDNQRKTVNGFRLTEVQCNTITDDYEFNLGTFGQKIEFRIKTQTLKSN